MFGSRHLYVFHHPQDLSRNPKKPSSDKKKQQLDVKPTYDSAQAEIAANSGFDMNQGPDKSKGNRRIIMLIG